MRKLRSRVGQVWEIEGTLLVVTKVCKRRMGGQVWCHPCFLLERGYTSEVYEWKSAIWDTKEGKRFHDAKRIA